MGETEQQRWELEVGGMTCDACATHVTAAIESVGAKDVEVSWRAGRAVLSAPPALEPQVRDAVVAAGYRPGELAAHGDHPRPQPAATSSGRDDGWDLAIVGSGSAAFAAAIRARDAGARVVMVERDVPGGTCVNVGCVPSKALLAASDLYARARGHEFAGIPRLDGAPVDLAALVAQKDGLVGELRQGKYVDLVEEYGFTLRHGEGRFADPETLLVDGEPLRARNYLVATGARPAMPPIDGLDEVDALTSTTALELTVVPRSLAVIGANAIGLELGQLFSQLGAKVTFLELADRIAPFEEPEISETLTEVLTDGGAPVLTSVRIEKARRENGEVVLEGDLGGHGPVRTERVLVATGRAPNTDRLDLAAAGVETDGRGFVVVDATLRTSNPRVWAAGDVTASPQFVYVSAYEGAIVADNAVGGGERRVDYRTLPRVTFTSPTIAAVGLAEAEARARAEGDVIVSTLPLSAVPRALVDRETRGVIKLVADASSRRLLGAHALADRAGEVIQAAVYALLAGLTVDEMAGAFHPYLTMAEGLKLAAQTFGRDVSKLSCCAA